MITMILATYNLGKVKEFQDLLSLYVPKVKLEALSDRPFKISFREDGLTFEDNARIKANAVNAAPSWSLADDSGLEVDALLGAPGVYSARYAGEHATDEQNRSLLLDRMSGLDPIFRTARFRCVLCLFHPETKKEYIFKGTCEGHISLEERGEMGFGYDSIFVPSLTEMQALGEIKTQYAGRTMAELPLSMKNQISHRLKAVSSLALFINRFIS